MTRPMPASTGAVLAHAAGQALAREAGVDLLHIKGAAVHPSLLRRAASDLVELSAGTESRLPRPSTDADVWVRPSQVIPFVRALTSHGWSVAYSFNDGSPFRHAMTLRHALLSPLDLHRRFPGIRVAPEDAFDLLWRDREIVDIAGHPCAVPSLTAQRLILLLHAVRARARGDIDLAWGGATPAERSQVTTLAQRLDCEVPLAAAIGRLEDFDHRPDYALWKAIQDGERSLPALWLARVRAEPTLRRRLKTGAALIAPKRARLKSSLGHAPTTRETIGDLIRTLRRAGADVSISLSRSRGDGTT